MWTNFVNFCRSCFDPDRSLGATPAGESGGGNTIAAGEDHSSEGYTTPRSLETPVQVNISMKIKNVLLVFPKNRIHNPPGLQFALICRFWLNLLYTTDNYTFLNFV